MKRNRRLLVEANDRLTELQTIQDNPALIFCAEVAKLADALDSGSSARKGVRVQIPPSAPLLTDLHYPLPDLLPDYLAREWGDMTYVIKV